MTRISVKVTSMVSSLLMPIFMCWRCLRAKRTWEIDSARKTDQIDQKLSFFTVSSALNLDSGARFWIYCSRQRGLAWAASGTHVGVRLARCGSSTEWIRAATCRAGIGWRDCPVGAQCVAAIDDYRGSGRASDDWHVSGRLSKGDREWFRAPEFWEKNLRVGHLCGL